MNIKYNKNNYLSDQSYAVLSVSVSFENMMDFAESNYSTNYDEYGDFENDFYKNTHTWESAYVEYVWLDFIKELNVYCDFFTSCKLNYKGKFFEQVDYVFNFVFKITCDNKLLNNIIKCLIDLENKEKDNFYLVNNNIEYHFQPSYSGENKDDIWDALGVSGIDWPPKIYDLRDKK